MTITEFILARVSEDEAAARMAERRSELWTVQSPFDPARVLAECEAKRWIVEAHESTRCDDRDVCAECGPDEDVRFQVDHYDRGWPCPTIRHLAAIWADHADYQPEWKVEQ